MTLEVKEHRKSWPFASLEPIISESSEGRKELLLEEARQAEAKLLRGPTLLIGGGGQEAAAATKVLPLSRNSRHKD